jgi:hypothetical protein
MKLTTIVGVLMMILPCMGQTAPNRDRRVPKGANIIAPTEGNLHPFLAAEILKRKLPIILVTDENDADFLWVHPGG